MRNEMVKKVKKTKKVDVGCKEINFMGGISYKLSALETLKMLSAASIFAEPQYYRQGLRISDEVYKEDEKNPFNEYNIFDFLFEYDNEPTTSEIMENVIDKALDENFIGTIMWAVTLRTEYFMRLNPQIIMVRAANHPKRAEFNEKNPGVFSLINMKVMQRADEPASQATYQLMLNGGDSAKTPGILKRNWAKKLESLHRYEVSKYKNADIGMIDVVRICHAHSAVIDELMKTGTVEIPEESETWERLVSGGTSWHDMAEKHLEKMGHMALLRNLRNISKSLDDTNPEDSVLIMRVLDKLVFGVAGGKQFPFRYYSAWKAIHGVYRENGGFYPYAALIADRLEDCIDISLNNMPELKGKTMCLSDNSGSAWGNIISEYGIVRTAEIDNLSSVITAANSEQGFVGIFGDKLIRYPISKRTGILEQAKKISDGAKNRVGGGTENGIWIFFRDAIDNKEWWDNIFIYSDQQAGHGGLYGTYEGKEEYQKRGFGYSRISRLHDYIDVAKLVDEYRKKVNPKVNVFSIQTAGYTNVVLPEYGYRTSIMYGWTGKEAIFAKAMIQQWDDADAKRNIE